MSRLHLPRLLLCAVLVSTLCGCGLFGQRRPAVPPRQLSRELQGLQKPRTPPPQGLIHTVKKGETLYSIARRYGVRPSEIMRANDIVNPSYIAVGQTLVIPGAPRAGAALPTRIAPEPDFTGIVSERNFIWPLRGRIIEPYDADGSGLDHRGITIAGNLGSKVVAAKSGVVTFVSDALRGYGKTILIQHSDGYATFYAYLSKILVKQFDEVKQGQVIGEVGQTGRARSPQLYFRLLRREQPVNPVQYLP